MAQLRYTRNLFLRGICITYLFAFLSFYVQIPGEALHLSAEATTDADRTSPFFFSPYGWDFLVSPKNV